jgi:hypothetical protein
MKYCTNCGSEYQDGVVKCVDCPGAELVAAPPPRASGLPPTGERSGEMDTRRFTRAGTAEDPLTAEQLATAVRGAGIPVFSRQRMGGTVDRITGGSSAPWWEILVPEESAQKALEIIERERSALHDDEDEAARAAEEEEAEGERSASQSVLEPVGAKPS